MDLVTNTIYVWGHSGVPHASLVPKVNPGLQEVFKSNHLLHTKWVRCRIQPGHTLQDRWGRGSNSIIKLVRFGVSSGHTP